MKIAIVGILAILVVLGYVFGYMPISAANKVKDICSNFVVGDVMPDLEGFNGINNVNIHTFGNDEHGKQNIERIIISGGWMSSCHVSYSENRVLSKKYQND